MRWTVRIGLSRLTNSDSFQMMQALLHLSTFTALLLPLLLCGCGSIDNLPGEFDRAKGSGESVEQERNAASLSHEDLEKKEQARFQNGDHAIRINRTLIYPCRWLRAEDLAVTLRPLLETRYGSGVRIVPHAVTNQLLIYIPPFHEQERVTRQAVPAASTRRSRSTGAGASGGTTVRRSGG